MRDFVVTFDIAAQNWNNYIDGQKNAIYAHKWGWAEALAATYSLPLYRIALKTQESRQLAGILPLIHFCPPKVEKRLISLPYTDGAGMVFDDVTSGRKLIEAALGLADQLQTDHLELRQYGNHPFFAGTAGNKSSWQYKSHSFKTGLLRSVPESPIELWQTLGSKVRNQIRKARKCGCTVEKGGNEMLGDFYRVFSENMRDLGSPVHTPELFAQLATTIGDDITVFVVRISNQPVAAAILIRHQRTVTNPWASSLRRFRPNCPNMLLYYSMLEFAANSGCNWFDFGRSSPNAPTCRFKLQWGAELKPLTWHVWSRKGKNWDPRMETLEYDDWKGLDLQTSRKQGPAVRRYISL